MAGYVESCTVMYSNPLISVAMAEEIGKQIFGMVYTPCRLTLRGRVNQRAGDILRAYDSKGRVHNVLVMEQTIRITGGLKTTISCPGETSDDAEFYSSSPTGKDVEVANSTTVAQLQAYANQGDANVLTQAKAYADQLFNSIINGNEVAW